VNSTHVTIFVWIVALSICLLMIPNYLTWRVVSQPAYLYLPHLYTKNSTETVYWFSTVTGGRLEKVSLVILALCFKILPVFILIVFSVLLILNIHHARQLRERLRRRYSSVSSSSSRLKRELRTTTMLVLITLFTVLVEFPQGLFFIASGIDKDFFSLYSQLGDIWDITSIGSSFITFIMYCLMSEQFRLEMYTLILPKCLTENFSLKKKNNHITSRISLQPRATITHTILTSPVTIPIPQDL
jgi:thyrotropin-releasing hormone receptor